MQPELALIEALLVQARIDAARGHPEALAWLRLVVSNYTPPPGADAPPWVGTVVRELARGASMKEACALARVSSATACRSAERYPQLAEAIARYRARIDAQRGLSLRPKRRDAA